MELTEIQINALNFQTKTIQFVISWKCFKTKNIEHNLNKIIAKERKIIQEIISNVYYFALFTLSNVTCKIL